MIYKAEMWDKMQHVMQKYNDHMTHAYYQFDRPLNEKLIKKAIFMAIDKVPLLKASFVGGFLKAKWKDIENFDYECVYEFKNTAKDMLEESEAFLLQILDERKQQIKVLHLRKEGKDTLSFIINHQVMDGGDLRLFYEYIAKVYTDLVKGGSGEFPLKNGSRSHEQLYKGFSEEEQKEVRSLISYSKKQKSKITFDFEEATKKEWYPKINRVIAEEDVFLKMKANCKKMRISLNDVILGSFYRVAYKMIEIEEGETLGIPNMVNLRRYMANGESEGLCNLTSMVVANLGENIGEDIFETSARCKIAMDELKKNYPGLHGLSLLKFAFTSFPYFFSRFLVGTFFKNPLIGISNIGIIDEKGLAFGDATIDYLYMTGSVKYPPYMQVALTTFRNQITFTIANYGTKKDHEMLLSVLEGMLEELKEFANAKLEEVEAIWEKARA